MFMKKNTVETFAHTEERVKTCFLSHRNVNYQKRCLENKSVQM
jgi:hypothetical protein